MCGVAAFSNAFVEEVARFRFWATTDKRALEAGGEWETWYLNWDALYDTFARLLVAVPVARWDDATTNAAIYAIARDNEIGYLIDTLAARANDLMALARRTLSSSEDEARWQVADSLRRVEPTPEGAEELLVVFAHDEEEYVRRRALLALGHMDSGHVEELAESAWVSGDKYQRIAALVALDEAGSSQAVAFAWRPETLDQPYLAPYALALRTRGTLLGFTIQGVPFRD